MSTQEEAPRCLLTLEGAASGGWISYHCEECGHRTLEQRGDKPTCALGLGGPPLPTEGVGAAGRTAQPDPPIQGFEGIFSDFPARPSESLGLSMDEIADTPEPTPPALTKAEEGYVRGVIEDLNIPIPAAEARPPDHLPRTFRLGVLCEWSVCDCRPHDRAQVGGAHLPPPLHEGCDCYMTIEPVRVSLPLKKQLDDLVAPRRAVEETAAALVPKKSAARNTPLPTFRIGERCKNWDALPRQHTCTCANLDGAEVVGGHSPIHEGCDCTVEAAPEVPLDFVAAARKRGRQVPTSPNQILSNALGQALLMDYVMVVARFGDGRIHTTLPDNSEEALILARCAMLEADQRLIDDVMNDPEENGNE